MAHGGEGAFNGIGRPQVLPVLGWEFVECQQRVSILSETVGRLLVFQRVAVDEGVEASSGATLVSAIQISCNARLAFGCWLFGSLASTFAVLCTQQRCSRVFGQTSPAAFQNPSAPSASDEPRRHVEPAPLQIEQQTAPVVRALAGAIGEPTSSLRPSCVAPISTRNALLFVLEVRFEMDAVRPDLNVALRRQIAPLLRIPIIPDAIIP